MQTLIPAALLLVSCAAEPFTVGSGSKMDAAADGDAAVDRDTAPALDGAAGATAGAATLPIPGGSFVLGREGGAPDDVVCGAMLCDADEVPGVATTVAAFHLDQFEVTVARFRVFVEAIGVPTGISCGPQATWTEEPGANEEKPINCVSWASAKAFCAWDGSRLPSEAEWEFAASGGEERVFPWSVPPNDVSIDQQRACYAGCGAPKSSGSIPLGAGRWGHEGLAGNVWEWVLDWYGPYDGPPGTEKRVARGGDYGQVPSSLRAAKRAMLDPESLYDYVSFRCATTTM